MKSYTAEKTITQIITLTCHRYDFVLNAVQDVGNYWFQVKPMKETVENMGLAILRYQGAAISDPEVNPISNRKGVIFQPPLSDGELPPADEDNSAVTVTDLESLGEL